MHHSSPWFRFCLLRRLSCLTLRTVVAIARWLTILRVLFACVLPRHSHFITYTTKQFVLLFVNKPSNYQVTPDTIYFSRTFVIQITQATIILPKNVSPFFFFNSTLNSLNIHYQLQFRMNFHNKSCSTIISKQQKSTLSTWRNENHILFFNF